MSDVTEPTPGVNLHDHWVRAVRLLDAPPERAHRAWSDPEELGAWFCRAVEGSLLVGARSTLLWSDRRIPMDVLESEPPTGFRFRWSLAKGEVGWTTVTVRIAGYGYGSRVSLEDGPFDLAQPGMAEAFGIAAEGWGEALANLRARVDFGVDLRRPVR
jgi:uncharacterized protein YndB with AHSA1/START domain